MKNISIKIPMFEYRKNNTYDWHQTDNLEAYKEQAPFGPNDYKIGDIKYTFNSEGFRCDEFSKHSDFPILFLGCSITEGAGLPLEDLWSHKLLAKIKTSTNKEIPYWSLALGGTGIDVQAAWLYEMNKRNFGFKYIFINSPPFFRREYYFNHEHPMQWPNNKSKMIDELFSDTHFVLQQAFRSLSIIDLIAKLNGTKVIFSYWGSDVSEENLVKTEFPHFIYVPQTYDPIIAQSYARDSMHPGKLYHDRTANDIWEKIKNDVVPPVGIEPTSSDFQSNAFT